MEQGSGATSAGETTEAGASGQPARPDQRRHPRFPCEGPVEVVLCHAEFLFRGTVSDISLAGCYVATRARLRVQRNQEVELHFTLDREQVSCHARVMDTRPGKGVGFEFLAPDERMCKTIARMIQHLEDRGTESDGKQSSY